MNLVDRFIANTKAKKDPAAIQRQNGINQVIGDIRSAPVPLTFRFTNLDLEDKRPAGGPQNDPASNYVHKFTPDNKYIDYINQFK